MRLGNQWRNWARLVRRDVHALYLASRDRRVPRLVRWLTIAIVVYALSPIDLIPDFIPVLGLLDDLILLPLAIALVLKLMPPAILDEHRTTASAAATRPVRLAGAAVVVVVWAIAACFLAWLVWPS